MKHIELTALGRSFLGEELGVFDENSPVIESNENFYNRAELLSFNNNIESLIEIYNKEKDKFKSEIDYIEHIMRTEEAISRIIEDRLSGVDLGSINLKDLSIQYANSINSSIFNDKFIDYKILEVKIPKYTEVLQCLKFWDQDFKHVESNEELLRQFTDCEYLIKRGKINRGKLGQQCNIVIELTLYYLTLSMVDIITKALNKKQLLVIDTNGAIYFNIGDSISVQTMNSIHRELANSGLSEVFNIDFELNSMTINKTMYNSDMLVKLYDNGELEFGNYTPLDYHYLLRKLYKQDVTELDTVFEIDNISCKASKLPSKKLLIVDR